MSGCPTPLRGWGGVGVRERFRPTGARRAPPWERPGRIPLILDRGPAKHDTTPSRAAALRPVRRASPAPCPKHQESQTPRTGAGNRWGLVDPRLASWATFSRPVPGLVAWSDASALRPGGTAGSHPRLGCVVGCLNLHYELPRAPSSVNRGLPDSFTALTVMARFAGGACGWAANHGSRITIH